MPKIISRLSGGQDYTAYHDNKDGSGANTVQKVVTINGGAGVASSPHALAHGTLTPNGVETIVSAEDLAFLRQHPAFQAHVDNKFIHIIEDNDDEPSAKKKVDNIAGDLNDSDGSRPLTEDDTKDGGRIAGAKVKEDKDDKPSRK